MQRLAVHYGWEKGPDAKSERQECPEAKGITLLCSPSYILFQGLAFVPELVGQPSSMQQPCTKTESSMYKNRISYVQKQNQMRAMYKNRIKLDCVFVTGTSPDLSGL